jgi:hypothetical protein
MPRNQSTPVSCQRCTVYRFTVVASLRAAVRALQGRRESNDSEPTQAAHGRREAAGKLRADGQPRQSTQVVEKAQLTIYDSLERGLPCIRVSNSLSKRAKPPRDRDDFASASSQARGVRTWRSSPCVHHGGGGPPPRSTKRGHVKVAMQRGPRGGGPGGHSVQQRLGVSRPRERVLGPRNHHQRGGHRSRRAS